MKLELGLLRMWKLTLERSLEGLKMTKVHYHACVCKCHNETHYFIQLIHSENRKQFNLKWTKS